MIGSLVRLRRHESSDAKRFYLWVNDPAVTALAGPRFNSPFSQSMCENIIREFALPKDDSLMLAIDTLAGEYIGFLSLTDIQTTSRSGELFLVIGEKQLWNKGYGTDAINTILRWAFLRLNMNRVQLRVYASNERAIRAYEKCGFKVEGHAREAAFVNGKFEDEIHMGVLAADFTKNKSATSE